MKPQHDGLAIVTATTNPLRAQACFESWLGLSRYHYPVYVVWSTFVDAVTKQDDAHLTQASRVIGQCFGPGETSLHREGGGVVPAFALGVEAAFADGAEAVLCLHDDVLMEEPDWDRWLFVDRLNLDSRAKDRTWYPHFAGFGGAKTLGSPDLYHTPYDPMQLARGEFLSNMREAEAHGRRTTQMERACVFDGFSQMGTKDWFRDAWKWLGDSGCTHHAYDLMVGCLAARAHVQGWVLPIRCHHFGGRTAVGDPAYQAWAQTQNPKGDQGFWEQSHALAYAEFKDVLPLKVR